MKHIKIASVSERIKIITKKIGDIFKYKKKKDCADYQLINLSIITQFYPPDYAATGQLIQELATHLSKQKNINISVFTGQPGYAYAKANAPSKQTENNVTVTRTRATRIWSRRKWGYLYPSRCFTRN